MELSNQISKLLEVEVTELSLIEVKKFITILGDILENLKKLEDFFKPLDFSDLKIIVDRELDNSIEILLKKQEDSYGEETNQTGEAFRKEKSTDSRAFQNK